MSIPILFIHQGYNEYLSYSLQQAKISNPGNKVILLGDDSNSSYASESVHHYRFEDYVQGAAEFAKVYCHLSSNAYEYELFCFQRWFILRDFLRVHQFNEFCYLDSDIMLYTDINSHEYQHFSYMCTWFTVNNLKTLEQFCQLMYDYFHHPALFERLVQYSQQFGQPDVSDMTFSSLYLNHYPDSNDQLDQETIDAFYYLGVYKGSLFDANLNCSYNNYSPEFSPDYTPIEMYSGKKKIYRINGIPYCKHIISNTYMRISFLHFQGPENKHLVKYFFMRDPLSDTKELSYFNYDVRQWVSVDEVSEHDIN